VTVAQEVMAVATTGARQDGAQGKHAQEASQHGLLFSKQSAARAVPPRDFLSWPVPSWAAPPTLAAPSKSGSDRRAA
jgi:hypothetical protein